MMIELEKLKIKSQEATKTPTKIARQNSSQNQDSYLNNSFVSQNRPEISILNDISFVGSSQPTAAQPPLTLRQTLAFVNQ